MKNEMITPITMTHEGIEYTLEFDNESVVFTNRQGFKPTELFDNIEEMLPILFYGAFRKHHKNISRSQTDKILAASEGLPKSVLNHLMELYAVPRNALIRDDDNDEETAKNRKVTFQF